MPRLDSQHKAAQLDLVRKRADYRHSLEQSFRQIIDRLAQMPEVLSIVSFGSHAAGSRDLFTDLDLIVVMDTNLDFVHRTAELYPKLQPAADLDLIVYTPGEFERERENPFLGHALNTGRVIYEKKRL